MFTATIAGTVINLRVAAICLQDDRLLICQSADLDYWYLPGGRVHVGESTAQALARELTEEIGIEPAEHRLVVIAESFATIDAKPFHEIAFYYAVVLDRDPCTFAWHASEHRIETGDGQRLEWQWVPLSRLQDLDLRPPFLKTLLHGPLPATTIHIVSHH